MQTMLAWYPEEISLLAKSPFLSVGWYIWEKFILRNVPVAANELAPHTGPREGYECKFKIVYFKRMYLSIINLA